ncbi:ATP-binding protein [Odoribacter splanchnicus]|uniref:ATP-binding protein n=1 Tax=Odoribacter splanchnicus TaxID=28118 RepID=UPI000B946EE1|nr:ATP-binding protein [Odoribacter splanchnicus]SNV41534.1 anti-sigma F factor [Odoribacter splanchnicus]
MNKLSISISSEISNIVKVENFVETFTDYFALPSVLYGKISLSVIEAVNNAILSGNKRQPDKMVSLVAEKTDKQFKVTVSDEGEGFDYEVIPDNINKITGRGLYLMKTLSDELIFENGGSTVTLVFNL